MTDPSAIEEFFRAARVEYAVESARTAVARVSVYIVDGEPVQAILPASLAVNLDRLLALTRGRTLHRADEDAVRRMFPAHQPDDLPPLGPLHGHAVFVDVALASEPEIVFSAGTAGEAIRMRWPDFAATVRPIVGRFAEPRRDRVGEFRLSYRE